VAARLSGFAFHLAVAELRPDRESCILRIVLAQTARKSIRIFAIHNKLFANQSGLVNFDRIVKARKSGSKSGIWQT